MKKDLVIAIFIGVVLGFGLSALFWLRNRNGISLNIANHQPTPTPTEIDHVIADSIENENEIFLRIIQPENEIISSQENITLNGETLVNATVVIIWEEGQEILVADNNGQFETEINLVGGENTIKITAYDNQGNQTAQTLTVTYSTAKF